MEKTILDSTAVLPRLNTSVRNSIGGPSIPKIPRSTKLLDYFLEHCTFFRIHLFAFTFIPLIFSGVFYASNGRFRISYLDSLFLCYSSMTVTGLSTVNLSTITAWQQVLLYILMMIGDITIVSWVMVLIRKRFFRTHCEYTAALKEHRNPRRSRSMFLRSISSPIATFRQRQPAPNQAKPTNASKPGINLIGPTPATTLLSETHPIPQTIPETIEEEDDDDEHVLSDDRTFSSSPRAASLVLSPSAAPQVEATDFGVTSATDYGVTSITSPRTVRYHPMMEYRGKYCAPQSLRAAPYSSIEGRPVPRRGATMLTNRSSLKDATSPRSHKEQGFGGFPGPLQILNRVIKSAAPNAYRKLERKLTMPSVTTLEEKHVPWLTFDGLVVGRNSDFHTETLSDEQVEEIGGAEYRALRLLSYLVPIYFVTCQLIAFVFFAPWLSSTTQYDGVFEAQPRLVKKPWFSMFQIMGAYTGGGLSLVDLGMIPFQNAYLMIVALMFSILAGNHAMPIFLRCVIWTSSKLCDEKSDELHALTFLLDHPRRCFMYLFPSHQTWFLVICLVLFSIVEWVTFLVFNIGLPAYESIPVGPRVLAGLFQGLAARASGFSIVPLASLAPALQFLYTVMMYIAIYPVALSIRSTNVYEERSLGVFEAPPADEDEEPDGLSQLGSSRERVGRYVGWHLRRQMSIDIWWLVWGVFIVTIIERKNLLDESKKWFDIFRIIFELVSAFGGIGLSLGFPDDNFSFVGAMHPLSKLVVIVIMVRGRHRGLPVAVDRAVLLPSDMVVAGKTVEEKRNEYAAQANIVQAV